VRLLCETLGVSPAGYYAWRDRPVSVREQRRDSLLVEIRAIHAEVKARYGSPRIHAELVARGRPCCVNTVARLMQENGLAAKTARKFRCTTDSNHDLPVADNLLGRQFDPESPNAAWVADLTYIPTREGWLYLAAVEDLYSRRVVGWSMADHLASRLVVDALALAVERRLPGEGCWPIPTAAAHTPAPITSASWPATASPGAGAARPIAGITHPWRASAPRSKRNWFTAPTSPPERRPGRPSSRTSRSSTTTRVVTPHWGTSPQRSTNGRNNR
jgi:transposase InsO family protein